MPYTKPHFEDTNNIYKKPEYKHHSIYLKPEFGSFETNYHSEPKKDKTTSLEKSKDYSE